MSQTDIVILAAGKGTRMQSAQPKVLHQLAGVSLLQHVLAAAETVVHSQNIVVTGHGAEMVERSLSSKAAIFVQQTAQLGTAHAVKMALPHLRDDAKVLILYGDVPLIKPVTIGKMLAAATTDSMALLTVSLADPTGYGRIIRGRDGLIESVIEQRDASPEQLQLREVNTGVLALNVSQLKNWLPLIGNNNTQGEYYLTDLIALARRDGVRVDSIQPTSTTEVEGVNNRLQLSQLERAHQLELAEALMLSGTSLVDPARFDQRGTLTAGTDNHIDINCIFEGTVSLGSDVTIGANCQIINSSIGDGVQIKANSHIEESLIGDRAVIGPYARLRTGTELGADAKIGNFVETKKTKVGAGSKINHLSYVGDTEMGAKVNIGAGTITCNYDGVNKHSTVLGNDVFIGSNSTLIAPIKIGDHGFVAAGSTVSQDVSASALAVGRSKQRNIQGWKRPTKDNQDS
jgi:bifunctional UDP-N-acetylglucosamine pyrophosphorylase/glucosamine-1-phosphate N-acetyltransferase